MTLQKMIFDKIKSTKHTERKLNKQNLLLSFGISASKWPCLYISLLLHFFMNILFLNRLSNTEFGFEMTKHMRVLNQLMFQDSLCSLACVQQE